MVAILMMSAKLAALDLLKINIFSNKIYDVIISFHDITEKIKFYHVTQMILYMWSCETIFGNSSISMRKVIKTSIL